MPRMRILSAADQARLEQPPVFDSAERKRYFDVPRSVLETAQRMRSPTGRIGFLLSYGYFRAARRFFAPQDCHPRDIAHVARAISLAPEDFDATAYKETTRLRHQRLVLGLQGFQAFDAGVEARLATEIATMARAHLKPRMIFGRCIDFLIEQRVQLPGVGRLTDFIRYQLADHKRALMNVVELHLTSPVRAMLDDLFERDDGGNRYRLSLLKKLSQSSRPTKVREAAAARDHRDQVFERRQTESARVGSLLDTLETDVFGALQDIRSLVDDTHLSPAEKIERIRTVLDQDRESEVRTVCANIRRDAADRDPYFQALEQRSRRLRNRINPILRVVRFGSNDRCPDLMVAITHFREKDGAVTTNAPMAFLDQDERDAVLPNRRSVPGLALQGLPVPPCRCSDQGGQSQSRRFL